MCRPTRAGISLLEVLIVIGIISLLAQLILPAIQASREAARRTACSNNLRQIGLSVVNFEGVHRHLPTAGWGWGWIGDPDRGVGKSQPGSWAYQILPFMERQNVFMVGAGLAPDAKHTALATLAETHVELFYCPSRRSPGVFPNTYGPVTHPEYSGGKLFWYNAIRPEQLAKTDYVANAGDKWIFWNEGPSPDEAAVNKGFFNLIDLEGNKDISFVDSTGVVFQRNPVLLKDITDGLTSTLFAGEKPIAVIEDKEIRPFNDDQSCWNGDDWDTAASTAYPPQHDSVVSSNFVGVSFGSPHPSGVVMVYCDASVRIVGYDVDMEVHRQSGNRADASLER
jgi:hypothetical protein